MKRLVLLIALLSIIGVALANPIMPKLVRKFWFDANGDLNIKFTDLFNWDPVVVDLFDGTNHFVDTLDISLPQNQFKIYPDTCLNPQQGWFTLTNTGISDFPDEVHWGPGLENDLSPLADGECGMQITYDEPENTDWMWVKELQANTESVFIPEVHSIIDIYCHDDEGVPVADVPIYFRFFYLPWAWTDATGHAVVSTYAAKHLIYILREPTYEVLFQTTFFSEPNMTYNVDVDMGPSANEDPGLVPARGELSLAPSVLHQNSPEPLSISYNAKLQAGKLALYDLKGRLVASRQMENGDVSWNLPELSSGVYFVRLSEGKKLLGIRKLIILK